MNKRVLIYALAGMMLASTASVMAKPQVEQSKVVDNAKGTQFFKGTFAQALAKAKKENKKLMVDCYTLWCGPCRYMSTQVFPNDTLGKYMNEHFVCMQLDMEHGEGPERNKTFKVKAYPTFIFFDGDGKEMNRFEGMAMKDEFQKRCERILKGEAPIQAEDQEVEKKTKAEPEEKDTLIIEGKGVKFLKGSEVRFADVLEQAKRENKRVLIDFWATWCHACMDMNKSTLLDTRTGNLLNYSFVNYSVDIDHDPDGKDLIKKYNVMAFPTYLILNPDGTEFNRLTGSASVKAFAKRLVDALFGQEDYYVKSLRIQKETIEKIRTERRSNLTDTPRATPKTKVKFISGTNLDKAVKTAKGKKKNLIVFLSDGDYKCDYMEKYVFNDTEIANYLNQNFICMFADVNSKSGDAFTKKYEETREMYPAFLLFNAKGEYKGCAEGAFRKVKDMKSTFDMYLNYVAK